MINLPDVITLHIDFRILTAISMLFFGVLGAVEGWKKAIVTLVGLFFAWGLASKTGEFLIKAVNFFFGIDFSGPLEGFFSLLLFVGAAVMVVVTFLIIINDQPKNRQHNIAGFSFGLLSGYFFIVLLLDLSSEWIAANVNDWTLTLNFGYSFEVDPGKLTLVIQFVNDATSVYGTLRSREALILLVLLLIFWHGLIFKVVGKVGQLLSA